MRTYHGEFVPILLGSALLLAPTFVLEGVAGEPWEVQMLRYVGLLAATTGVLWRWATHRASVLTKAAFVAAWVVAAVYFIARDPLALFAAFCLLAGAAANLVVSRAVEASESLRTRLESGSSE